jgi:hypothetical protein
MTAQQTFTTAYLAALMSVASGCGGTIDTGTAKKPVNNKPAADGSCPGGRTLCGEGIFAICVDLQTDPNHCGTCDRACSAGIACQASLCQQSLCTGATLPFSGQPTTTTTSAASPGPYPLDLGANQLLADVNGDGRLDRIEWFTLGGICQDCKDVLSQFRVSLRQPDGSFAPADVYQATDVISKVFATDVNSDGLADLYIVSWTYLASSVDRYQVELWLGQTDGHLVRSVDAGIRTEAPGGGSLFEVAIGDLSGDGWPDLVMAAPDPNLDNPPKINVYLSDSTGALHLSQTFAARPGQTFIRDWNGDGSPDLGLLEGTLQLLYNRGDGTFEQPLNCALLVGGFVGWEQDLVVEDLNRDGWMDIATEDLFKARVAVMFGLGGCGFAPISYYDVPGTSAGFLRTADMNGDGILDLVSVTGLSAQDPKNPGVLAPGFTDHLLAVLLGSPDGTFHLQTPVMSLGPAAITAVNIGEVTGDGRPDIVVSTVNDQTGQTTTWENTCQ